MRVAPRRATYSRRHGTQIKRRFLDTDDMDVDDEEHVSIRFLDTDDMDVDDEDHVSMDVDPELPFPSLFTFVKSG